MRLIKKTMILCATLLLPMRMAHATIIILIVTNDGYWIASDGIRSDGKVKFGNVCKIHETNFGFTMKSGKSQDFDEDGKDYSTDTRVREEVARAKDATTFQEAIKKQYVRDLKEVLVYLMNDGSITAENIFTRPMSTPIPSDFSIGESRVLLTADLNDPVSPVHILSMALTSKPSGQTRLGVPFIYGIDFNSDWRDLFATPEPTLFFQHPKSVYMFSHQVNYLKPDAWVRSHPRDAIEEILGIANKEDPTVVGPPYSIVHVLRSSAKKKRANANYTIAPKTKAHFVWVARGKCPSWEEVVLPDPVKQSRNPRSNAQGGVPFDLMPSAH